MKSPVNVEDGAGFTGPLRVAKLFNGKGEDFHPHDTVSGMNQVRIKRGQHDASPGLKVT